MTQGMYQAGAMAPTSDFEVEYVEDGAKGDRGQMKGSQIGW